MDANGAARLAAAWVRYQVAPTESDWWAVDQVYELVEVDLTTAWDTVNALCDAANMPETLCDIGAGPLEDMIYLYGIEVLHRLDEANEKLLDAACCVWLKRDAELELKLDSVLRAHGRQRH
jgi:hypothetical protein